MSLASLVPSAGNLLPYSNPRISFFHASSLTVMEADGGDSSKHPVKRKLLLRFQWIIMDLYSFYEKFWRNPLLLRKLSKTIKPYETRGKLGTNTSYSVWNFSIKTPGDRLLLRRVVDWFSASRDRSIMVEGVFEGEK